MNWMTFVGNWRRKVYWWNGDGLKNPSGVSQYGKLTYTDCQELCRITDQCHFFHFRAHNKIAFSSLGMDLAFRSTTKYTLATSSVSKAKNCSFYFYTSFQQSIPWPQAQSVKIKIVHFIFTLPSKTLLSQCIIQCPEFSIISIFASYMKPLWGIFEINMKQLWSRFP